MKYFAFVFPIVRGKGGMNDCIGKFDTVQEAKDAIELKATDFGYWGDAKGHIACVENDDIVVTHKFSCTLLGNLYASKIASKEWLDE